jgi:hypothetical protein
MAEHEEPESHTTESQDDVNQRLAFPLLVPVVVFLFAVLVIYGLSRIYLELNTIEVGDVTMATPLAIGVSLFILFSAWFLATNRRVPMYQVAGIGMVAVFLLTGGAIWAAVDDRDAGGPEGPSVTETPSNIEPGTVQVSLIDPEWAVTANPDTADTGDITFNIENDGVSAHNLRVVRSDLAPESLPLDAAGLQVDESAVVPLFASDNLSPGDTLSEVVTLEPGAYVLFCNVAGHYEQGMHTGFTVQ